MPKKFSWSFTKANNYDTCPKKYYEVDVEKRYADTNVESLNWGNEVHAALAKGATTGEPLHTSFKDYQKWADQANAGLFEGEEPWLRHLAHPDRVTLVEQQFAMTEKFEPCGWKDWDTAWCRGICDLAVLDPTETVGMARDYKTGKVKHDSRQLMIMAQLLFIHHPTLRRIRTEFVWLKHDCVTPETFSRDTIHREWPTVLNIVREMKNSADTMTYEPRPNGLCRRWCPVVSCPFHGKGA